MFPPQCPRPHEAASCWFPTHNRQVDQAWLVGANDYGPMERLPKQSARLTYYCLPDLARCMQYQAPRALTLRLAENSALSNVRGWTTYVAARQLTPTAHQTSALETRHA